MPPRRRMVGGIVEGADAECVGSFEPCHTLEPQWWGARVQTVDEAFDEPRTRSHGDQPPRPIRLLPLSRAGIITPREIAARILPIALTAGVPAHVCTARVRRGRPVAINEIEACERSVLAAGAIGRNGTCTTEQVAVNG
jgi:hypothetical protein